MKAYTVFLALLLLTGCENDAQQMDTENGGAYVKFKGARLVRVDVDGVDCVVGAGNYDTTVAVSCDWANKKEQEK